MSSLVSVAIGLVLGGLQVLYCPSGGILVADRDLEIEG